MQIFSLPVAWRVFAAVSLFAITLDSLSRPSISSSPEDLRKTTIQELTKNLPLAFEENQGQIDSSVRFVSRGSGYQFFLTSQEAVMILEGRKKGGLQLDAIGVNTDINLQTAVVRMRFEGGNRTPVVKGVESLGFKSNYFIGDNSTQHLTDIKNYSRVRYESIYPGIDLFFYGNHQQLEYDFIVAPRAKPNQIKLSFVGADNVSVTSAGELLVRTSAGDFTYRKPIAYQHINGKRKVVNAEYLLANNGQINFSLGKYDTSRQLIIDPILSYSSFLWGTNVTGVAVDASGNAYVAGYTYSADLPVVGGYKTTVSGNQDAYLVKIDPTGTKLIYATYLGARRATTFSYGVSVDNFGSAYVIGTTGSSSFPVTTGAYQTVFAAGASFITKLNAAGNALAYSTFVNGATLAAITVDAGGSAYLTGKASTITTTAGAFQPTKSSSTSPFVAKLNAAGSAVTYATYLGGTNLDEGRAIAVDGSGNAYVTGIARSIDFPTTSAFQANLYGVKDAFITKLNPTGTALIYSTYLGGSADDVGNGIAVDAAGQAHVAGMTYSNDFPVTAGVFQPRKGYPDISVSNAFITKLSSTGTVLIYSSYLGGRWCLTTGVNSCFGFGSTGIDGATAVAVDAAGYAYVGGFATSIGFPLTDPIQVVGPGGDEWSSPFVAKVQPSGNRLIYSVVLGARVQDGRVNGLAVDSSGNAYAAGYNGNPGSNYPMTAGPLNTTGGTFIFKLSTGKYPTTLQSSINPGFSTQPVTFTAAVLSATPGGIVTFMNGTTTLGTAVAANGAASMTTILPVGVHKITAVYSGDGKTSPVLIQMINPE